MTEPVSPAEGIGVVHLFCHASPITDRDGVLDAVAKAVADGVQIVSIAVLGHKADIAFMALGPDLWQLRRFQTAVQDAGLDVIDSYVSITESSEYAKGLPPEMVQTRLYPQLPPEGKPAWCFYPMSKRREAEQNWYTLPFDERKELMHEHGASGRKFKGRILQLITGSAGLDDFEWGVTLFGQKPDDLKAAVYTMRYDTASALYGEFGAFYTGLVATADVVLDEVGIL